METSRGRAGSTGGSRAARIHLRSSAPGASPSVGSRYPSRFRNRSSRVNTRRATSKSISSSGAPASRGQDLYCLGFRRSLLASRASLLLRTHGQPSCGPTPPRTVDFLAVYRTLTPAPTKEAPPPLSRRFSRRPWSPARQRGHDGDRPIVPHHSSSRRWPSGRLHQDPPSERLRSSRRLGLHPLICVLAFGAFAALLPA